MLARVAERMYWFGRYLERAENMARFVEVNGELTLDVPQAAPVLWKAATDVIECTSLFLASYDQHSERNVVRFMLADQRNPASLVNSVRWARENVRSSREVLPGEAWENINRMHHYVRDNVSGASGRKQRGEFLDAVVGFSQRIAGLLLGAMSHTEAFCFVQLGRNIERADMTTRIVDVGARELFGRRDRLPEAHDDILWTNVLRSTSAYQMYRQYGKHRATGPGVVDFLFRDRAFPRAVAHCLGLLSGVMEPLPRNAATRKRADEVLVRVNGCNFAALDNQTLHRFIDELQGDLGKLHTSIQATWFGK